MDWHKDEGGAAFPVNEGTALSAETGMSLRDYFAGQALHGLLADPNNMQQWDGFAKQAYDCADAMLAAREVKP